MLSPKAETGYCKWSGDTMGYTHALYIYTPNGRIYVVPDDETDEAFADRIKRSDEAGRNLFYEELEEFIPGPFEMW